MKYSEIGKTISISLLSICAVLALLTLLPHSAHGGTYADSAHGDSTAGVERTVLASNYAQGNCAHCHEQHASIDGSEPTPAGASPSPFLTFSGHNAATNSAQPTEQSDNYCFYCHAGSSSVQSGGAIDNKDYSITFGGYTAASPAGIFEAFSYGGSHHNLYDLYNYARTNFGSTWFKVNSNPCLACHNVHIAKRNKSDPKADPPLTAISLPSDHGNLWGDGAGEKISDYSAYYQAPYYSGKASYEPGGTTSEDGSLHPDYNTFCLACHDTEITRASGGTIKAIDWETTGGDAIGGDKHGKNSATGGLFIQEPYVSSSIGIGFVLSCLDCHEPHGSTNAWLLRRFINGTTVSVTVGTQMYYEYVCSRCHTPEPGSTSWKDIHHSADADAPYIEIGCTKCHVAAGPKRLVCSDCHYHGAVMNNCERGNNPRRTF